MFESLQRPWMGFFLRVMAVLYAMGGLVHVSNILGFGGSPWFDSPLSWRVADVAYAFLDTGAAIGLWFRKPWGVGCFALGAASQLVLYGFFPHHFAFTEEHRQGLRSMLAFHGVTLAALLGLLVAKK